MKLILSLAMAIFFLSGMSLMAEEGKGKRGEGRKGPGLEGKKGKHAGKKAEIREKVKNMTEEERKAFFAKMKEKRAAMGEGKKGKCKKGEGKKGPKGKKAKKA